MKYAKGTICIGQKPFESDRIFLFGKRHIYIIGNMWGQKVELFKKSSDVIKLSRKDFVGITVLNYYSNMEDFIKNPDVFCDLL